MEEPTPLCKSIHSIDHLQSDYIDFTLKFCKIPPCWVIQYNISIRCFIYNIFYPKIRIYTIFSNIPCLSVRVNTFSDHLKSYSIDFALLFRKLSPLRLIPYNLLISCFVYILFLPTIRLYTIVFENYPPPCAIPYTLWSSTIWSY